MRPLRRIFALLSLLAFSISGIVAQQQSQLPSQVAPQTSSQPPAEGPLASAARDLARKVADSLGADLKGKIFVDGSPANLSSASLYDFQQACAAFSAEFTGEGMTIPSANAQQAMATIHLTLSQNFQGLLWIADVMQGSAHSTFFSSAVPPNTSAPSPATPQLTLQKIFLMSSPDPILDAEILPSSSVGAPESLRALQPESVALYTQNGGAWQLQARAPVQHQDSYPWPRDLHGRLQLGQAGLQAMLPGIACDISVQPNLSSSCKLSDATWAVSSALDMKSTLLGSLVSRENLFTSAALPGIQFDSLAEFEPAPVASVTNGFAPLKVLATLPDGRALLFEGSATPVASFTGWGSDIAALWSRSRQRWPILVTRDGDWTGPDAIQAFDIVDRQAVPVSAPIDFDGPITALWSEGENEALAVSRNLKTGLYEAYLLRATYN